MRYKKIPTINHKTESQLSVLIDSQKFNFWSYSLDSFTLPWWLILSPRLTYMREKRNTWHIRWNSPSSGWMPKSPDASRGTLPNQPLALCKNILWPRKHKLVDIFWNKIQKAQRIWCNHILYSETKYKRHNEHF